MTQWDQTLTQIWVEQNNTTIKNIKKINMTPKEKAEQLDDKMYTCYQCHIDKYTSKQCALKAVDEILNALKHPPNFNRQVVNINTLDYWKEVKQEIELL